MEILGPGVVICSGELALEIKYAKICDEKRYKDAL